MIFWTIKFDCGKLDTNHHDWSDGKNGVTIFGPKLKVVILETITASGVKRLIGRRLWFYTKSGACWNFDVYFVRASRPTEGEGKCSTK